MERLGKMFGWLSGNRKFDLEAVDDAAGMLPKLRLLLKDNPQIIPHMGAAVLDSSSLLQRRFGLATQEDAIRLVRVEAKDLLGAVKDMEAALMRFSGNPSLANLPSGRGTAVTYALLPMLARLRVVAAVGGADLRGGARSYAERIATLMSMTAACAQGRASEDDVLAADW